MREAKNRKERYRMKLHINSQGIALWEECGQFKPIEKYGTGTSDIDLAIWKAIAEDYPIFDNRKDRD